MTPLPHDDRSGVVVDARSRQRMKCNREGLHAGALDERDRVRESVQHVVRNRHVVRERAVAAVLVA